MVSGGQPGVVPCLLLFGIGVCWEEGDGGWSSGWCVGGGDIVVVCRR